MTPRIIMLISNFYPVLAGAEQQALNLSKGLMANDIPVCVLTRAMTGEKCFEIVEGIPVYRNIRVLDRGKLFGISYILTSLYHLFKLRQHYHIIHCHIADGLGHVAALVMAFFFNKKVIVKIALSGPESDFKRMKASRLSRICLKLLHHVDRIVTICSWSYQEAEAEGFPKTKITFIPNGVDIKRYCPTEGKTTSPNRIAFIGRLSPQKGVDSLLQAFASVARKLPDLLLDIIGDGPQKASLIKMAEDLKVKDKVIFHGTVQQPEPLLTASRIFVLPSRSEGLSNALLEAMACGLPVVATNVGGNIDLIRTGQNGLLVEKDSPDHLAGAIEKLLIDPALADRLGQAARNTIVADYGMEPVTLKYIALYHELLKDRLNHAALSKP